MNNNMLSDLQLAIGVVTPVAELWGLIDTMLEYTPRRGRRPVVSDREILRAVYDADGAEVGGQNTVCAKFNISRSVYYATLTRAKRRVRHYLQCHSKNMEEMKWEHIEIL